MGIADITIRVHDTIQRHASELEEVDLLPVKQGDPVFGVRQADERNPLFLPVLLKGFSRIGSHSQDLHTPARKLIILISQARQLRAAVRSHKAAQERQNNRPAAKIRQTDAIPLDIFQLEIRSQIPWCD